MNNKTKELLVGVAKSTFSAIPFVGGAFNEICFDIRSRIVQQRLNNFTNSFLEYIKELGIQVDEVTIRTETFNDLYISILKRVTEINCKHKLIIFREILTHNIQNSYQSDFRETFLDLVSKLDYIEIEILKMFKNTGRNRSLDDIEESFDASVVKSKSCEEDMKQIIRDKSSALSTIEVESKYEFYICDLTAKSLLIEKKIIDYSLGGMGDEAPLHYMTNFGKEFLRFIQLGI